MKENKSSQYNKSQLGSFEALKELGIRIDRRNIGMK